MLALVVIVPLLAGAQVVTSTLPDPGTLPDSPFYFLKSWREGIQLFFTFDAEKKAEQYLHLAEVRLAEYQKMIEKGKQEIAERTLKKYEDQLNRALQKAEELKSKSEEKASEVKTRIKEATSKHLQVLHENLLKIPEFAQANEELVKRAQDVTFISSAQYLGNDLKNYFSIKGQYPKSLKEFFSDKSYRVSIAVREEQIDEFISKHHYVVSSQYDHFVLFIDLSLPKEKFGTVNKVFIEELNAIDHDVLGVQCGDQKIFCVTDATITSTENETYGWKIYRNEQYGFYFKFPSSWQVRDDSYSRNGQFYPLFHITSPDRLDLVGYQNTPVHYLIQISVDPTSKQMTSVADFAKAYIPGDQSPWNTNISKNVSQTTNEYAIGQKILSTFKFIPQ